MPFFRDFGFPFYSHIGRRPTLEFISIYTTFVGRNIFRGFWKSNNKLSKKKLEKNWPRNHRKSILKDNQISAPFLEEDRSGLKKYKILKVTNRYDEHKANYSKDYTKIKELALKEKQVFKIKEWMDEKIESTYININSDYKNCNFKNKWVKRWINL